ncbi:MAG: hypothetical protein WDO12_03195 [Pseudomonadota bacterium]
MQRTRWLLLALTFSAHAADSMLPDTACTTVKKAVARRFGVPESGAPGADWFCDVTPDRDSTLFLVALRTARPDARTHTNLLGWFAVDRVSGKLFKWDEKTRRTFAFDAASGKSGYR